MQKAEQSYLQALEIDPESFFPNYNMGVLKSNDKNQEEDCLKYFLKSLQIAQDNNEEVYQINVNINLALVHERAFRLEQAI